MKQASIRLAALLALGATQAHAQPVPGATPAASIAAVVNGQVITAQDVSDRARLLAVSAGMPSTPELIARLAPQVTKLLIDQTLELQEINRRNVVVDDKDVVAAVTHIEQGNNLPPGGLRARLAADGVPFSTLVQQLRIELGWQSVLHQVLGPGLQPTQGDLNAEKTALHGSLGATRYAISEIFIPVTDPASDKTAKSFADTVIGQLRTGAPFALVAAQFSQAQSALQGGDRGAVTLQELDPQVAAVVSEMPDGAVSNPIRVPGGYEIVQLKAKQTGGDVQTMLSLRQIFGPFPTPITNGQVGPAQADVITKVEAAAKAAHSCPDMEAANAKFGNIHPADPGPVNLATVSPPAFQAVLAKLQPGGISQPLIDQNGVSVVMLCSRSTQAAGLPPDETIANIIIDRRVELESQQLLDNLRHQSIITGAQ